MALEGDKCPSTELCTNTFSGCFHGGESVSSNCTNVEGIDVMRQNQPPVLGQFEPLPVVQTNVKDSFQKLSLSASATSHAPQRQSSSMSVKSETESEFSSLGGSSPKDKPYPFCKKANSEYEEDDEINDARKITVGICAMNKKSHSKPMNEILSRLQRIPFLEFEVFSDEVILLEPIEHWPIVDCLISFYSKGFPLEKAIEYAKLRNPVVLNDLENQYLLQDRRMVYKLMVENDIEVPRHAILNRDHNNKPVKGETEIVEYDDVIEVNGQTFTKPFVEKPVNAEDHGIYIYYPASAGGGCQILFRKIGSRSSVYSSESRVRRTGSYIYEEFMATDGTDVKVYTIGTEYAHAEARKSPALDGKVERDAQGKEIRYPVILSGHEKKIAKKVCEVFKQTVCGFDFLRANHKSYVCDVNGFSFVKTSQKYYDDCSQVLSDIVFSKVAPHWWIPNTVGFLSAGPEEVPVVASPGSMLELRCVVGVIRHGDRTPKQKMKMFVQHDAFFQFFTKYGGPDEGRLKLKKPKQLQEVLDITRQLLEEAKDSTKPPIYENQAKLLQMKGVLEMYGHFSGINRKVQMKSLTDKRNLDIWGKFKGRNKKSGASLGALAKPSLLVIVKWGGELTPMGKKQAEELGKAFRCMYPGGEEYGRIPGCGFLRLHSTYRHDLKIYASDEGRVQMTAAAFAKGLLALEGELTPILVHLVKSDKYVTNMLDTLPGLSSTMQRVKSKLHDILHSDQDFVKEDEERLVPTGADSLVKAMRSIINPHNMCELVYDHIQMLIQHIKDYMKRPEIDPNAPLLYHEESISLMLHRWQKLEKDFKTMDDKFDISLIPDIYDCVKYDYLHNSGLEFENIPELYRLSKLLADIVIPQEYGITHEEKLAIAQQICNRLMRKIKADFKHIVDQSDFVHRLDPRYTKDVFTPHRHVRTRLYFTSESHVHSMLTSLRYGGLFENVSSEQWKVACEHISQVSELSYLTQIVLMQYEDPSADPLSQDRYHIELYFSPGLKQPDRIPRSAAFLPPHSPRRKRKSSKDDLEPGKQTTTKEAVSSKRKGKRSSHTDIRRRRSETAVETPSQSADAAALHVPITVLQYNNAISQPMRMSPPKKQSSFGKINPLCATSSVPMTYAGSAKGNLINLMKSQSNPMLFSPPMIYKEEKRPSDTALSVNAEHILTLPSLHPLVSLHSGITQRQMDGFFDRLTDEGSDSLSFETQITDAGVQFGEAAELRRQQQIVTPSEFALEENSGSSTLPRFAMPQSTSEPILSSNSSLILQ